jgi:hypothetical protein
MSLRTVGLKAAVLIATACALVAPASSASAADSKDSCKSGGYASYVDPATGQPFANQGQCVSFAAKGGTLTPVELPVSIVGVTTTGGTAIGDPGNHLFCTGTVLTLAGSGTHTVALSTEGLPGYVGGSSSTYTATFVDGSWSRALGGTVSDTPITVTVDGQPIGTATPDCAPA